MASHRTTATRRLLLGLAAVALLLGGGVAVAASTSTTPRSGHRTATVGRHPVAHELTGVGTIEPVAQASVAFPVAGTVSAVSVRVGDLVSTGQALAGLDTTALQARRLQAQAALDAARLKLARALAGQSVSGAASGSGSGTGGAGGTGTATATATPTAATGAVQVVPVAFAAGPTTTPGSTVTPAEVAKAQQAVLAAQRQVDTSLAAAKQALDDATAACASVTGPGPTSTTAPTTTTPGDPGLTACRDALQAVLDAQQQVRADQATLAAASTTLDDLLARQASQPTRPPTTTPGSATPGGSGRPGGSPSSGGTTAGPGNGAAGGSGGNGSGASGATTATLPSASELVAYQKAVDAAEADLAVAVQGVAQGAIVSPISGAVAAVHLAPGQHVTAASATDAIVIVGPGGFEVTTTVAVTDLASLKVGQAADVVPDGSGAAVAGRVVAIGVTPDTSGTTATYPVTVGITGSSTALRNGATGTVRITTGSTSDALAVPTSAITSANGRKTVQVLAGGKVSSVDVQVGVAGDVWTAVTSGLQAGQEVVLADLSAPLPGSATNGSSTSGSGQNRFGGGGLPGGFQTRPGG